jgi:S-adenosylmethionine:tRNA ribosyltransferase-isomerase
MEGTGALVPYLAKYGSPIRYGYLKKEYPIDYYQTVFATEAGSAEMPSAGRAFTAELVCQLIAKGIEIVPILLHTGVASLEADERPYAEFFRVTDAAADRIRHAKATGRRIIAVGTTVVRALESAASPAGFIQAAEGWTDIFIQPERGLYLVDGLLTGFHEPNASHSNLNLKDIFSFITRLKQAC